MNGNRGCHVMAKPTGSVCNIDCTYCFYLEKEALYPDRANNWKMSDATLEEFVKQHIEAQPGLDVDFAWQGGEPTLMGIEFFEKAVSLCSKHSSGKRIHHSLQTNGILLNDKWGAFLSQHNFLVGISIDGPEHIHDQHRVNRAKKGTHKQVMQGIAILQKHNVEFNTLTVVGKHNVEYATEVYQFLLSIGSRHIQFIPLIERESTTTANDGLRLVLPGESTARLTKWSVPSWQFGEFLNIIFDTWVQRDIEHVYVQMFDTALRAWCNQPASMCVFSPTCGHAFALESNGDLYNCDHYVYPEHKLGNIHTESILDLNRTEQAVQFGLDKQTTLTRECQKCEFRFACNGGCPKHRFSLSSDNQMGHNYLCAGYKHFFNHAKPYLDQIREQVIFGVEPANTIESDGVKIINQDKQERNSRCNCGSGKKYKRCCGK
ncbi:MULTISPECIES: anaerobic sulfatase maturase [unclassified Vibrio]|uniref:anaerobic sulfatase maturase n=1 Tax=unclassified Vibrio TaxID=2614977 RepID=UPI00354E28D0